MTTSDARKRREEVRQAQAAVQESFNRSHAEFAVREDEHEPERKTREGVVDFLGAPIKVIVDEAAKWVEDFPEPDWHKQQHACEPPGGFGGTPADTDYVPAIPSTPEYIRSLCVKINDLEAKVAKLEAHTCACETVIGGPRPCSSGPLDLTSQGMPLDEHGRFQTALPDPVDFR